MVRFMSKLTVAFWCIMIVAIILEILKALFEFSMIITLLVIVVVVKTGYQILCKG